MGVDMRAGVAREAVLDPRAKLVEAPTRARQADHGDRQATGVFEGGKRREDLLKREITRRAEEHERVGLEISHRLFRRARQTRGASPRATDQRSRLRRES